MTAALAPAHIPADWSELLTVRGPDEQLALSPDLNGYAAAEAARWLAENWHDSLLHGVPLYCLLPDIEETIEELRAWEAALRQTYTTEVVSPMRPVISLNDLSPDRQAVARMVAAGLTNKEIAHSRGSTEQTVKNMITILYQITGTTTRVELAVWTLRWRLNTELRRLRHRMVAEQAGDRSRLAPYIRLDSAIYATRRVLSTGQEE